MAQTDPTPVGPGLKLREPPPATDPMLPADSFARRSVLVTGGGSGVGLAMAEGFALCGASVAILSRKRATVEAGAETIRRWGGAVLPVTADVRRPEEIEAAFDAVEAAFGPVSVLVNSAGSNFPVLAENLTPNGWRAITQIAYDGVFFCSQIFHRRLRAHGSSGAILNNLASYAWTGFPGDVHSASAKAGVMNLTLTLAGEWARDGVRVNGLAIGTYPHSGVFHHDPDASEGARGLTMPARRSLRSQELGWAAAYLCSPFAAYITGQILVIDGGDWLRRAPLKPPYVPPRKRERLWLD